MRGAPDPSFIIFIIPFIGGLYLHVLLRMGRFWLPGGQVITRATHPRGYWLLMGLTLCALAAITGYAAWKALPAATARGH
jgi:hypothetical protein